MVDRPVDGDRAARRRHYEIERELAGRLRNASKEERKRLYGELYAELFRRVELPGNAEAQLAQVGLLLRLLEPLLSGRRSFLEIGAGACRLSLELAGRLDRVWAVDAVDPAIDPATAPGGFRFVTDGEFGETVQDDSVDLALSCHFVEHLHPDDLADHLTTVLGKLTGGGAYVVVTPNRLYGPHDVSRGFSPVPVGFHLREYTHIELADELRAAGFDPVHVISEIGAPPSGASWWKVRAGERFLDAVPFGIRRWCLDRAPRQAPFRPLEQVKLIGFKPEVAG